MDFIIDFLILFCLLTVTHDSIALNTISQAKLVEEWARIIGKDLNVLGLNITEAREIETRYRYNNAQVQKKDPDKLLAEIVGGVTRMLNRKMDSIKCLTRTAEDSAAALTSASNEFEYHSSKYSRTSDENITLPESIEMNEDIYLPMEFNIDSHFYNIAVNTSYSSVHVPTNVYDRHEDAAFTIQWSESLDDIFVKNYESDPALSWQYFGSSTGIMRHYPAMRWTTEGEKDSFDCRVRTWYIEAATCTKDIVILVDNSGSMTGMNKHIASLTVYTILSTLSNNDYVNILNYSTTVNYTVPCFKNKLIQATPENIQTFKQAVSSLDPQDKSHVEAGLIESFRLLEEYREARNCTEDSADCNQAIMLITDGIQRNYSDTLLKYNSMNNGSIIPVRIFTYLIGKEINNLNELVWIPCHSKGYFSHVSNLEQVTAAVFKYINVIARPLILAGLHTISWTHTYIDIYTYDEKNIHHITEPYRLLTSAAIPVFNTTMNRTSNVELLGVAGTDVPIDSIQKLTFPHKLGVNAHAFIVTNNGYVLMHPGLRPMFKDEPTANYNSVDFTEVQQLDDGSEPRDLAQILLDLRAALVKGETGVTRDISLKYHYNNMGRVSRETFDFYYSKLKDTPFTMALALPNRFGYYAVQVPDEISMNKHLNTSILDFFKGDYWRIHPKWVYCKYHYLEGHEYETPEDELLHFLSKMYDNDFKWNQQYEEYDADGDGDSDDDPVECDTTTKRLQEHDYYCDRELINMLIFDAKSTLQPFNEPWLTKTDIERELSEKYNATLRFVATMSGLTRWEYIFGDNNNNNKEFGDYHARAIDETWYKSAVLQHEYMSKSFVYSVPLYLNYSDDLLITGSYAIFPKDAGMEAPASVVGFQFSHARFVESFQEITNFAWSDGIPCGDNLNCYIIDNSGYILASFDVKHTGIFIGEVEGCVLESLLEIGIFETLPIYDYQSSCLLTLNIVPKGSKCSSGLTQTITNIITWILNKIIWFLIEMDVYKLLYPLQHFAVLSDDAKNVEEPQIMPVTEEDDVVIDKSHVLIPCDQRKDLYVLNETALLSTAKNFTEEIETNCPYKYYYMKPIPTSNLLLIAVRFEYNLVEPQYTTRPEMINYENISMHPCQKLYLNGLPRTKLSGCFNRHPDEELISACGYKGTATYHYPRTFQIILAAILLYANFLT